jgi:hypothetical protein
MFKGGFITKKSGTAGDTPGDCPTFSQQFNSATAGTIITRIESQPSAKKQTILDGVCPVPEPCPKFEDLFQTQEVATIIDAIEAHPGQQGILEAVCPLPEPCLDFSELFHLAHPTEVAAEIEASTGKSEILDLVCPLPEPCLDFSELFHLAHPTEVAAEIEASTGKSEILDLVCPLPPAISSYTADQLNNGLTLAQRNAIAANRRVKSMAGNIANDYGMDFFTLSYKNKFGTFERFTDTLGGQAYANEWVLDHAQSPSRNPLNSVLAIRRTHNTNMTWETALSTSASENLRLLSKREAEALCYNNAAAVQMLQFAPFNNSAVITIWLSEEVLNNTANSFFLSSSVISASAKTGGRRYVPCYEHIF